MSGAMIVLGLLSLCTPVVLMVKDGVRPGDDKSFIDWMIGQPPEKLQILRGIALSGIMMVFSGICVLVVPG